MPGKLDLIKMSYGNQLPYFIGNKQHKNKSEISNLGKK